MASLNFGASIMKTVILKDPRSGWKAETTVEIKPALQLEINTRRFGDGRLISRASVWRLTGDGSKSHCFGFGMGGDFGCHIVTTTPARVTSQTVTAQHERAMGELERVKLLALDHYVQRLAAQPVQQQQPLAMEA
jgi:hypothetical protein